jgi:alkaline phosphatase D
MKTSRRSMLASLGTAIAAVWSRASWGQSAKGYFRLMQGPMVGAVSHDQLTFFLRTSSPLPVAIEIGRDPQLRDAKRTAIVTTDAEGDYIANVTASGLQPDTLYYYRPILDGGPDRYLGKRPPMQVRTAPLPGTKGKVRIAFGSCARIQAHPVQPIWTAIREWRPDLFLWLGDNVYHDTLEPPIMAEMYRWQRLVHNLQPLLQSVPQLAIWDDHDYALNDSDRTNPAKQAALEMFKRYWPNPAYGLSDVPGVFFDTSYGAVDLFMLDGRWYRNPVADADGPGKTLLGRAQLDWLKQRLKSSKAIFKLVACGSGWNSGKGPQGDSWAAYLHERDGLFDFIRDEKIGGVVLLSGDTHVGELNCIPRSESGGYDLYELVSSPLAQDTRTNWLGRRPEMRLRDIYVGGNNFGAIEVDTTLSDPELRLNLLDEHGNQVWDPIILRASDLRNGVKSWPRNMDEISRQRMNNVGSGKNYFAPDIM